MKRSVQVEKIAFDVIYNSNNIEDDREYNRCESM